MLLRCHHLGTGLNAISRTNMLIQSACASQRHITNERTERVNFLMVAHSPTQRACVFLNWSKMAIIRFCPFFSFSRRDKMPSSQEQTRSIEPSPDHGRRIKTILGQFRNKHARFRARLHPHFSDSESLADPDCFFGNFWRNDNVNNIRLFGQVFKT